MEGIVYVDASALVKVVAPETQSAALTAFLEAGRRMASSAIALVEVSRALLRLGLQPNGRAIALFAAVTSLDVSATIVQRAAALLPAELRTLDAIHLASALELGSELTAFVTYDRRLADAAAALGLPVVSPT